MYYPVYDAIMGARGAMVLWHIWHRYVWYICCMFFAHCMSCHSSITTPTCTLQLPLSWCIFKLLLYDHYSSPVHNCSSCVVDCLWPRCQRRYPTACGDCCPQLPLPGHLCELTYFYYRLYALCRSFLIFAVFNNYCEVLTSHQYLWERYLPSFAATSAMRMTLHHRMTEKG